METGESASWNAEPHEAPQWAAVEDSVPEAEDDSPAPDFAQAPTPPAERSEDQLRAQLGL